jgi:hypothetical protein
MQQLFYYRTKSLLTFGKHSFGRFHNFTFDAKNDGGIVGIRHHRDGFIDDAQPFGIVTHLNGIGMTRKNGFTGPLRDGATARRPYIAQNQRLLACINK